MKSRILYITHRVPYPPDRGDRIRTWNILKFLSQRADVDLACLADEPVSDASMRELERVSRRLAVIPHQGPGRYVRGLLSMLSGRSITAGLFQNSELADTLMRWHYAAPWDGVLASSSGVAQCLFLPGISECPRRWVDLIDVDSQKWKDYVQAARFPMNLVYGIESIQLRALEKSLARRCNRLLVVSEAERDLFRSFCSDGNVSAVGNGVDSLYFASSGDTPEVPYSCTFVGVMNYKPNVDAVCWFASRVWPAIRERYPQAEFRIVGKSPSAEVEALARIPGVRVTGGVPDVRQWLYSSTCVVVPLHIARGVQNKVLEAMAAGRPVICSPAPLKGLATEPGVHVLQADSASEWVTQISRTFEDTALRQELGMAAAAFVQLHHSWNQCLNEFEDLITADSASAEPERQVAK